MINSTTPIPLIFGFINSSFSSIVEKIDLHIDVQIKKTNDCRGISRNYFGSVFNKN